MKIRITLLPILIITLVCCSTQSFGQNYEKMYKRGIEAFYNEDFVAAVLYFQKIESSGRSVKDSEYRLEIAYLIQPAYRERSLETILKFRETKGRSDKFFYYWLGRIYANRYMFPEAVEAWSLFLNRKGFKSEEIVSETKDYIAETEKLVAYFDNPDNFEIHQLESPVNTEFAEITPVYSDEKNELLFASNRANPDKDEFNIYHATNKQTTWSTPTSLDILGKFDRDKANLEVVNEDGKLFIFKDVKKGDLYYSEPGPNGWTAPVQFDSKINSTRMESHFYINEHEDRIIFATHNKKTGFDLMESFRDAESGDWEKPHPFAANLNTEYDEDSPFLSQDETRLYFLSDRPNGIGGFDVYESTFNPQTNLWEDPVNMGWPINSPDDEIHFKMNPDMNSGYFSSNRIHSKGDFDIFFFWKIEKISIEGRVINALTQEPVTDGEIRFHPVQYLDEYFRSRLNETGKYRTEIISDEVFKVEVISHGDTLLTENFEAHDSNGEKVTHFKDFYVIPKDISEEQRLALEAKYRTKPKAKTEVELDSTSTTPGDVQASAKPRKAETPTASGKAPAVQPNLTKTTDKPNTASIAPVNNNSSIFIGNIYFEFGTSTLTDSSLPRLQEIKEYLLANPQQKIEIAGHADNIGSKQVNLIVSQNRADAAKKWLTDQGIDPSRITAKGYGETQPMATNDDEKEGRALNRRIEIRAIE